MNRLPLFGLAIVGVFALAQTAQAQDPYATLEFSLFSPGGTFVPKHITAVWVTTSTNAYIETIYRAAANTNRFQWLSQWNAKRGTDLAVDGYTGATPISYVNPITATWDCLDRNNNPLPDGDYRIWVEFTEAHAQGPYTFVPFTKDASPHFVAPPDLPYIKDIQLNYVPEPVVLSLLTAGALALVRRRAHAPRR